MSTQQGAVVEQAPGDQVHDLAVALDHALHSQQAGSEHLPALAFHQVAPEHHVDASGLVLQRHENDPAGGIRTLPAGHETRGAHHAPLRPKTKLLGGHELEAPQAVSQQCERMPAERQAEAGIVGDYFLAFGGWRKRRYFLFFLKNI
jgi:hypothetical protein